MFVDRLYYPVTTLGPGERIVVWTRGCTKHCPGCANPELWETRPEAALPNERVAELLLGVAARTGAHRLTITGGDPLEQADDLAEVLAAVRPAFDDILVYTGFALEDEALPSRGMPGGSLPAGDPLPPQTSLDSCSSSIPEALLRRRLPTALAPLIDVIIDGPYVAALNDGRCGLRGSTNQRVIVRSPHLENLYHEEEQKPRRIQNAVFDGRALSIGIHGRPPKEERP